MTERIRQRQITQPGQRPEDLVLPRYVKPLPADHPQFREIEERAELRRQAEEERLARQARIARARAELDDIKLQLALEARVKALLRGEGPKAKVNDANDAPVKVLPGVSPTVAAAQRDFLAKFRQ